MVGFIFGIIFLIAGIVTTVVFAQYKTTKIVKTKCVDENGNTIVDRYGDVKYRSEEAITKPLTK